MATWDHHSEGSEIPHTPATWGEFVLGKVLVEKMLGLNESSESSGAKYRRDILDAKR